MVNPDNPSSDQVTTGHVPSDQPSDASTNDLRNIELGLLDLVPVSEGMTMSDALHATIRSAQAAERAGYDRFGSPSTTTQSRWRRRQPRS